ncbi:PREDICTED: protein FANTASTIC FOUR 3-like [Tarenaya hassleriana]|uniref:protein FANTASTIC FOUR 3-like n=1 Tax=Tarenaya hassleriana TaxID=28532 RepID=UPI00053C8992|nr:PREDICTED: protein FANTASTIC FOUR 3-like [Tarenaya hassleriana]XP_010524808.1 PREDICTED: protein FANTASTIC FOUR 3-like [Tarenaya hassleriana]XP_010524810.1 PREDICTED: protein FANTASTIC FOUR 3-like [Tarenaya hassleriana]
MATVVCHKGFQPCLESQLNEPFALRLRLSSPNPHHFFQPLELSFKSFPLESIPGDTSKRINSVSTHPDSGCQSFLEAISSGSPLSNPSLGENERTYGQCSPSKILSEKSLALCTENLGNESGSDDISGNDVFSFASSDVETKTLSSKGSKGRKGSAVPNLPPPLKSMRGSDCIHLRPYREDGRLVLKASKEPLNKTCFQVERGNGRLRLCILRDYDQIADKEEEEEMIEPESDALKEEEEEEKEGNQVEGMVNHIQSPGRCVHGDRDCIGLLNWEHFCVATS